MDFEDYKREIRLIERQNHVEQDMYSIIATVIRERMTFKNCSLRDVSSRRRTKNESEKLFWGISGFPDFVILSEEYDCKTPKREELLGAVEVKAKIGDLINRENIQLKGHIMWFNKVIYTDGLIWKYYEYKPDKEAFGVIKNLQSVSYYKVKDKWNYKVLPQINSFNEKKYLKWEVSLIESGGFGAYKWEKIEKWNELLKKLEEEFHQMTRDFVR